MMIKHLSPLLASLLAISCATEPATETVDENPTWTDEQKAAYEQCLQDNMAVAMAWEMIEQSCREQVDGDPDPLDVRNQE